MDLLQQAGGQRVLIEAAPLDETEGVIELEANEEEVIFNPDGPDPLQIRGCQLDIPEDARDRLAFGFGGQPVVFGESAPLPIVGISVPGGYSFNVLEKLGYDMEALRAGQLCDPHQVLPQPFTARRHEERPRFRNALSPAAAGFSGKAPTSTGKDQSENSRESSTTVHTVTQDHKRKHKTSKGAGAEKSDEAGAIARQMIFQALKQSSDVGARHRRDRLQNEPAMTSRRKVHRRVTASPELLSNSKAGSTLLRAGMRRVAAKEDLFLGSDVEPRTESTGRRGVRRRHGNADEKPILPLSSMEQVRQLAAAKASLGLPIASAASNRRPAARRFASESPAERHIWEAASLRSSRARARELPGVFVGLEAPRSGERSSRRSEGAKNVKASSSVRSARQHTETESKCQAKGKAPSETSAAQTTAVVRSSEDGGTSVDVKITEDGRFMVPIGLTGQVQMRPLAQNTELPGAMSEGLIPTRIEETTILHPQVGSIGPDGKATLNIEGLVLPLQDPEFMKKMLAMTQGTSAAECARRSSPPALPAVSPRLPQQPRTDEGILRQKALAAEIARQMARSGDQSAAIDTQKDDPAPKQQQQAKPPVKLPPPNFAQLLDANAITSLRLRPPTSIKKFQISVDEENAREVEVVTVCREPKIQLIRDLLSADECNQMDILLKGLASRPDIPNNLLGSDQLSKVQEEELMRIVRRMAALSGLDEENFEGICPSEIAISSGDSTADFKHIIRLYLDEPHEGYSSDFLNLGISLFPRRGCAIRWTCRAENGRRYEVAAHKEVIVPPNSRRVLSAYVA